MPYAYRDLSRADAPFLLDMLRVALGWRVVPPADGSPPPVAVPPRVFDDFGRAGDGGVLAEYEEDDGGDDREAAGACWYRLLPASEPGHGHAGAGVPELTIAVLPWHRAQGVGGGLLDRAVVHARERGVAAISLTVEADNPARGMYERRGFDIVSDESTSLTLRKLLR